MDTPDEWLTLPKVAPFLDESLGSERSAFIDLTSAQLSDFLPDDEHRWVRKIIAPDLSWVLSVPIVWRSAHVERVPSEFVVLVNGDKLLLFTAEPLEQVLAELEADIKSVFAGIRE